jgi:uncharacterized membrane protein
MGVEQLQQDRLVARFIIGRGLLPLKRRNWCGYYSIFRFVPYLGGMKDVGLFLRGLAVYLVLCVATYLMLRILGDYTAFRDDVGFLRFKQAYVGYWWWKLAFYVHVFTAILALLAGFTQFSDHLLADHRRWHRLVGRVYAYDILLVNFPSGMVLAFCANGLLPGRIAFMLLDSLWFTFTLLGVQAARRGQIDKHRAFMLRSYALTFSAITLRTWKFVLVRTTAIDPVHLYMLDAWLGFVPNLLVAEWWIRSRARRGRRRGRLVSVRS